MGIGGRGETKEGKRTRQTKSSRAGLFLPISRFSQRIKKRRVAPHTSQGAPVFLTAAMEHLTNRAFDCIVKETAKDGKQRITPKHIQQALHSDAEFVPLVKSVMIAAGGVVQKSTTA